MAEMTNRDRVRAVLAVEQLDLVKIGITGLSPIEPACMDIAAVREEFLELVLVGKADVDLLSPGDPGAG